MRSNSNQLGRYHGYQPSSPLVIKSQTRTGFAQDNSLCIITHTVRYDGSVQEIGRQNPLKEAQLIAQTSKMLVESPTGLYLATNFISLACME